MSEKNRNFLTRSKQEDYIKETLISDITLQALILFKELLQHFYTHALVKPLVSKGDGTTPMDIHSMYIGGPSSTQNWVFSHMV